MTEQTTLEIVGDETVIEAAERTGKKPKRAKNKGVKVIETVKVIEDGNDKDNTPVQEREYFYGIDRLFNSKVKVAFSQVKAVSRMRYVHNIHVENPHIIAEKYIAILKDHRYVCVGITKEQYEKILEHPHCKKVERLYAYTDLDAKPKARQYCIDHDGWPTEEEIRKTDEQIEEYLGIRKQKRKESKPLEPIEIVNDESLAGEEERFHDTEFE